MRYLIQDEAIFIAASINLYSSALSITVKKIRNCHLIKLLNIFYVGEVF